LLKRWQEIQKQKKEEEEETKKNLLLNDFTSRIKLKTPFLPTKGPN